MDEYPPLLHEPRGSRVQACRPSGKGEETATPAQVMKEAPAYARGGFLLAL